MAKQRLDEGRHVVIVLDEENRIVESSWNVAKAEVPALAARMQEQHPQAAVYIDGQPLGALQPSAPIDLLEEPCRPDPVACDDDTSPYSGVRLSHTMLWTTFDRAARVQAWMLQQANVFTRDLLENNRKLADQASEMQQRFQQTMQRLDLMETEKKLMEHDLMARRLSRHTIAQNRAEEEASRPPPPPDNGWVDELLTGVSTLLGGVVRPPPKSWPQN
jgi:hypothetical protein